MLFAAIVALLSVAAPARAADAVVLSAGGPGGLADEARAAAIEALEADGVAVVPDAEVAVRVAPARLRAVTGAEQARALAFELEARAAVVIAVWPREGVEPPAAETVVVSWFVGSRSFTATEPVGDAGLAGAVVAAVRAVRAQQTQAMLANPDLGGEDRRAGSGSGAAGAGAGKPVPGKPVPGRPRRRSTTSSARRCCSRSERAGSASAPTRSSTERAISAAPWAPACAARIPTSLRARRSSSSAASRSGGR